MKKGSTMNENEADAPAFDESMAQLEELVAHLEAGELPLEDALRAFEKGVGLVRGLTRRLNEAESRVEILTRDAGGNLQLQELDPDSTGE